MKDDTMTIICDEVNGDSLRMSLRSKTKGISLVLFRHRKVSDHQSSQLG